MQDNFSVWASSTNTCPLHVSRRKAGSAVQLDNITVLHHLIMYCAGITTDIKWMAVENSKNYVPGL